MEIEAVFDGTVFRPTGPLPAGLKPGDAGVVVLANGKPPAVAADDPSVIDLFDGRPPVLGEPGSSMKYLIQASQELGDDGLPADYSVNWEKYLRDEGH